MKKLLNTLYILTPDSYLYVRNGSVAIRVGTEEKYSIPAHNLDAIVCFGQNTVSTPLISLCAENDITLTFISNTGKFIGRFCGPVSGNVLLRKRQYQSIEQQEFAAGIVQNILYGKLRNSKAVLQRSAVRPGDRRVRSGSRISAHTAPWSAVARTGSDGGTASATLRSLRAGPVPQRAAYAKALQYGCRGCLSQRSGKAHDFGSLAETKSRSDPASVSG